MNVERLVAHGFNCSDNPRQIFGPTARHDRVDSDFFDGDFNEIGWYDSHNVGWGACCSLQHPHDAFFSGGNHRKSVGPPSIKHGFEFIFGIGNIKASCRERGSRKASPQVINPIRINTEASTAGAPVRQFQAESGETADLFPIRTTPTHSAFNLLAVENTDDRGNSFDVVVPTD